MFIKIVPLAQLLISGEPKRFHLVLLEITVLYFGNLFFLVTHFLLGNNIYIDDINLLGSVGLDNELENTLNFYIAPNPSYGYANINFNLNAKLPVKVDVMDLLGQKIETLANSTFAAGEYKLRIGEKVNYSPGIYLVNLQLGDKFFTSKLIIE